MNLTDIRLSEDKRQSILKNAISMKLKKQARLIQGNRQSYFMVSTFVGGWGVSKLQPMGQTQPILLL